MTLTVPTNVKTVQNGLAQKQAQINTLAAVASTAPHASQSAQLLLQQQRELVAGLLEHNAIAGGAAAILSTVSYTKGGPATAILAQITATQAQITAQTTANPVIATQLGIKLDQLQRQAVIELLNSGQMSPTAVLAAFAYTGAM
jgi:hypothetical protein